MSRCLQLLFFTSLVLLAGCHNEEPNPENLDPIYSYLLKEQKDLENKIASDTKKLEEAQSDYEFSDPLTIERRNASSDMAHYQRSIYMLKQQLQYIDIRVERRKVEDHVAYKAAFSSGKQWPPKDEYEQFMTSERLRTAPRSWDAHLPKLFERKPAAAKKEPAKKAEE